MPSRVISNEDPMHNDQGIPSLISIQPTRNHVTAADNSISRETNVMLTNRCVKESTTS